MEDSTNFNFKKHLVLIFSLFAGLSSAFSQHQLGLINSNFGGTNVLQLNPANMATPKNIVYFNFWSQGIGFQNDFLKYDAPFSLKNWASDRIPSQYNNRFSQSWLPTLPLNGDAKNLNYNEEVKSLSIMFPTSLNSFFAFSTRRRSGLQVSGLDEDFARIARYGIDNSKADIFGNGIGLIKYGTELETDKGFKAHLESWQEYTFSFAGVLQEDNMYKLSGGFSLKFLRGMGVAHLSSDDLKMTVESGDSVTFNSGSLSYAHSSERDAIKPFSSKHSWFNNTKTGFGMGLDLGLTWMKKLSSSKKHKVSKWDLKCNYPNEYEWKIGAAIMDLGYINHTKGIQFNTVDFSSPYGLGVRSNMMNGFTNSSDGFDVLDNSTFALFPDVKNKNSFMTTLPTAFAAQADYRFGDGLYLGVNYQVGLKPRTSNGLNADNFISFIPRFEKYFIEAALPITVSNVYNNVNVGFFAKLWFFHIGSDNIAGLMNMSSNKAYTGASLYGGFSFPIPYCYGEEWIEKRRDKHEPKPEQSVEEKQEPTVGVEENLPQTNRDTIYIIKRDTVTVYKNNATDCVDCENRLSRERNENDKLNRDLDYEKRKSRDLELDNQRLRDRLYVIETEKIKCESERAQKERDIVVLQDRIRAIDAELIECKKRKQAETSDEELKRLRVQVTELENEKRQLEDDKRKCENDKSTLDVRVKTLEKSFDDCQRELKALSEQIKDLRTENERLKAEVKNSRDSIKMLVVKVNENGGNNKEIKELQDRIKVLEAEKKICDDANKTKDLKIKNLRDSLNNITVQYQILEKNYDNLMREYQACAKKIKDLEAELKECNKNNNGSPSDNAELNKVQKDLNDAQDRIATLEKHKAEYEAQIKTLNTDKNNLNVQLTDCQKQYESTMKEFQAKAKEVKELETQLKNCKNNQSDNGSSAEIEKLQSQINSLQNDLSKKEAELNKMQKDVISLNAELEKCKQEKASTSVGAVENGDVQKLQKEISELNKKLNDANAKVKSKDSEITILKNDISSKQKQIELLQRENSQLKDNVNSLQKTNSDLLKKLEQAETQGKSGNVIPGTIKPSGTTSTKGGGILGGSSSTKTTETKAKSTTSKAPSTPAKSTTTESGGAKTPARSSGTSSTTTTRGGRR